MKKITDFIVKNRNIFLIIFIILTGICLYTSTKVNINSDITKYLPKTSETKTGKDIMDSEFEELKSSTLNVMFKGLTSEEKIKIKDSLSKIEGVSSIDYDDSSTYNSGDYTLYVINVDDYDDSETSNNVYNEVNKNYDYTAMSGSIYEEFKPVLQFWIVIVAIAMAMIILTILSESYIEPWLYLVSIGIAVFLNKGTNIIFSSVSNITDSIVAILQLALSMDYSIMLSNRYRQEREKEKDKIKAMKNALYDSFKAISSSSITTVVGLLALVFMSFTIGKDLGFVLAKGVFLSLVSIFFCLPGLLILFDKLIMKSKKKKINFNLTWLGKYSYKTRYIQLFFIIVAFILAFILKGNIGILYTGVQEDEVDKIFPATNQIAIVYKNEYENIISDYCKKIENGEKENQVLCYGNTINEKLAYNELNDKFKDLGYDTNIDDYLLKLIYYNYYNENTNDSMTLDEFIKFIKSDVYTNEKISSSVDDNTKENIDLLENFSTKDGVTKERSISDISNILGIDEDSANDILIYYNSKNLETKMSIKEFIDFILNDVSTNKKYSKSIDSNTLSSLKQLYSFTDASIINKQMTSSEISNLFGIDKSLVDQLFLFYRTTIDSSSTMTINEFATFSLSLKSNPSYSSMFTDEVINKLTLLQTLSNEDNINKEYKANELSNILSNIGINNLDEDTISMLYFYSYYLNNEPTNELTINEFANFLSNLKSNSLYSNYVNIDDDSINTLKLFSNNTLTSTKLDYKEMCNILSNYGFTIDKIKSLYIYNYTLVNNETDTTNALLNTESLDYKISCTDLISFILERYNLNDANIINSFSTDQISLLEKAYSIIKLSNDEYTYQEIANILSNMNKNITEDSTKLLYSLYTYQNIAIDDTKSIKEVINFLENNKENQLISSKIEGNTKLLSLGYIIVNNTSTKYTYQEMSSLINQDEEIVKDIYGIVDYSKLSTTMSPIDFVNLILDNKGNTLINKNINNDTISSLNLVKTVMISTINNSKYNATQLSKILNSNKDTISLVMSLYNSKYIKNNQNISLINFTNFIISDVITNKEYMDNIDSESKDKLICINGLMNNTLNDTKYSSLDLYNILNKLTDKLDYNLIDLVYIYNGSKNNYNESWKLTIEEIVTYLNNDILKDPKYLNFMDNDMITTIKDSKEDIDTAKKLLVSDEYSRAIINSKYGLEDEDTFKFIENTLNEVGNDGVYVVGDSPMALEMSKTFNGELNYITILTMIFIFVVVAITFKDLLIPLILVLIIQCAVYVTMAVLSLTGTNVYFIALLIVQAILMGATIDYAIVYTTYYKEMRQTLGIQESIINAYNKSIHTILSSSSILIIVTLVVATFSEAIPAMICETVSEGTFCSVILILFILPGVLAVFDKFICRKN